MDNLKPCPFCGGEAEIRDCGRIIKKIRRPFYTVRCSVCMGTVPRYSSTILKAIEVWNMRVAQTTVNQYGENCTHISNCGTLNLNL